MAYVGDCEDWEAGSTQHNAEMIKLNSEKRKVKGERPPSHSLNSGRYRPAIFIQTGPIKNAQDLKSCEGFPREGSSPSPGTIESTGYENPISPEKAKFGVL